MTGLAAASVAVVTAPGSRFDLLPVVRSLGFVVASLLVLLVLLAWRCAGSAGRGSCACERI